jgi:hypothetical protein
MSKYLDHDDDDPHFCIRLTDDSLTEDLVARVEGSGGPSGSMLYYSGRQHRAVIVGPKLSSPVSPKDILSRTLNHIVKYHRFVEPPESDSEGVGPKDYL